MKPKLSRDTVLWITFFLFIYASVELGIASWISTYSIKAGIADVESSAFYGMLFWVPNCFGRIIWMYYFGSVRHRLGLSVKIAVLTAGIILLLQLGGFYQLVCIIGPLIVGTFASGTLGLGMSVAVDEGFNVTPEESSYFILGNAIGDGLLIMPLGYLMQLFGFKSLIVCVSILAGMLYYLFGRMIRQIEDNKRKFEEGLVTDR